MVQVICLDGVLGAEVRPRFATPEARAIDAIQPDPRNTMRKIFRMFPILQPNGNRHLRAERRRRAAARAKELVKEKPPVSVVDRGKRDYGNPCPVCRFALPPDGSNCQVCARSAEVAEWLKTPEGQAFYAESEKGRKSAVDAVAAGKIPGFARQNLKCSKDGAAESPRRNGLE